MLSLFMLLTQRAKTILPFCIVISLMFEPTSRSAEAQSRLAPSASAQVALPQLADGLGWKQPRYYLSIQTADIDGDGQSEILARWIDGVDIYRYQNGAFVRHSHLSALSDNAGFSYPSSYSTIRTGVLDRKLGQADVIARKQDGIHVFRYDRYSRKWRELGAHVSARPFANKGEDGTDWTQSKRYLTIQLADLTGDGVLELVGRGQNGIQVWRWEPAGERWVQLSAGGVLADEQGYGAEPYYSTIHWVDVDRDGAAELTVRAPGGIEMYKWTGKSWVIVSRNGPFGDGAGLLAAKRYRSVHVSTDATGRTWAYGLVAGTGGSGSGELQVHRWRHHHWQAFVTVPLPGSGWNRESQVASLIAADLQGDAQPEFLVRGSDGLHAYTLAGRALALNSQSFTDAQGWNLAEQYSTMKTAMARITERDGTHIRTLILGRGSKGLEAYKFEGKWTTATQANFPQYCSNFNTDSSPQCLAYISISNQARNTVDVRPEYLISDLDMGFWQGLGNPNVNNFTIPAGVDTETWQTVLAEMKLEFWNVGTVHGWFHNTNTVVDDSYGTGGKSAQSYLDTVVADVDFATSKTVFARWLSFGSDIASAVADFLPEGGAGVNLIITIFQNTYDLATESDGDINEEITTIRDKLAHQGDALTLNTASLETSYLTDYSKLQLVGSNAGGSFDWSNADPDAKANAEVGAERGMKINFFRELLPYKWWVDWCSGAAHGVPQFPNCGARATPGKYDCFYGNVPGGWGGRAYLYAGASYDVNFALAGRLTGKASPTNDNVDAIWYMMLLGSDLGWDLPQYQYDAFDGYLGSASNPSLSYDNLKYGVNPVTISDGCNGNGSTTGILSANQTLGRRLLVAQQNGRRVTASEADGILKDIHRLNEDAEAASPNQAVKITLTSPLREAAKLIEQAKTQVIPSQQGSVSATTPTHLTEWFIKRVEAHRAEIGTKEAGQLAAEAYSLIAELEGQSR